MISSLSAYRIVVASLSSLIIPRNWKETIVDPRWKEAMF